MGSHLNECDECRLEFHRLQYAAGTRREFEPDPGMLDRMRAAIHRWEQSTAEAERTAEAVKGRVRAEIAPFLGDPAATAVLKPVAPGADNLLNTIEPVLALFLGGKAAGRLVSHVVDSALLRT